MIEKNIIKQTKYEKKISIIGSCVTRDAINIINDKIDIDFYAARSSLVSIYTKNSIECSDQEAIQINKGEFEQRMVLWDLRKIVKKLIERKKFKYLILDCIDERFNLCFYKDSIFTLSNYIIQSEFYKKNAENITLLHRNTKDATDRWCRSVDNLSLDMKNTPVIIHKAYWATKFFNYDTNKIEQFTGKQLDFVVENNKILDFYYSYLKNSMPWALSVANDESLIFSDFAHKWGKDYFHYGKEYYFKIAEQILNIIS